MNLAVPISAPPETLFDELVTLDGINMAAHFSAAGDKFDSEIRRRALRQEWHDDAEFLLYYRQGVLAGYCEFMPSPNGKLAIRSLQTNAKYSRLVTLRALLGAALPALEATSFEAVTSGAHPSNALSLKLHGNLGFQIVGRREADQGGERILFEASVQKLHQRVASIARAKPAASWRPDKLRLLGVLRATRSDASCL